LQLESHSRKVGADRLNTKPAVKPQVRALRCRAHLLAGLIGLGALGATVSHTAPARAQASDEASRVTARRLAEEAADLYDAGKYEEAQDLFRRAFTLHPAPTLALWEARALVKLGRLVQAEERYTAVERFELDSDSPELFHEAVEEAAAEVDKLRKRIPTIVLTVEGAAPNDPALEIQIDGHRLNPAMIGVEAPANPGKHQITALVDGVLRSKVDVTLHERDRRKVTLEVGEALGAEPAPKPVPTHEAAPREDTMPEDDLEDTPALEPDEPQSTGGTQRGLGTVTLGLGIVGLTTGVVAGLIAVGKHSTLEENCPNGNCPPAYHDDLDAFRTFRTVSTIGYSVGAGGVVVGTLLLLTSPSAPAEASSDTLGLWVGLGSAGVSGRF